MNLLQRFEELAARVAQIEQALFGDGDSTQAPSLPASKIDAPPPSGYGVHIRHQAGRVKWWTGKLWWEEVEQAKRYGTFDEASREAQDLHRRREFPHGWTTPAARPF